MAGSAEAERTITLAELRQHKDAKSLWLAINDTVYDVTKFMEEVSYFDIRGRLRVFVNPDSMFSAHERT